MDRQDGSGKPPQKSKSTKATNVTTNQEPAKNAPSSSSNANQTAAAEVSSTTNNAFWQEMFAKTPEPWLIATFQYQQALEQEITQPDFNTDTRVKEWEERTGRAWENFREKRDALGEEFTRQFVRAVFDRDSIAAKDWKGCHEF